MLKGTWLAYLEEIDTSAKEMVDKLVKDMATKQGITEELKAKDQMAWIGAMNNLKHSAEENEEIHHIYQLYMFCKNHSAK